MNKIYSLFIGLAFSSFISVGQIKNHFTLSTNVDEPCAQHKMVEHMQQNDPARYAEYLQARSTMQQEANGPSLRAGTIYKVPVVFHVVHNNGVENISDAQIENALFILNRDFRKQNADISAVVSQFLPIAGDVEIEFYFAKIAPDGTCFNGITRTVSTQTNNSSESGGQSQINAIIAGNNVYQGVWPHNKYLNIVVAKTLVSGAAGYTFLPNGSSAANAENMYYNSIFMLHNYTGAIGTSNETNSRALTHETGHWLNLSHVWGDGNIGTCGNDYVTDTPQTNGSNGVCTLTKTTCDGNLDNVQNYMDYSYCSKMFTNGQVSRMRSAITSPTAGRNNIWTTANLQLTGVEPGGNNACLASINATNTGVCAGSSTTFSVENVSGTITAYSWSFPGGTPATSTQANPTITYNTPGTYNTSVTITVSGNNSTITQSQYITVASSSTGQALPLTEGFTNTTFPPTNWTLENGGNQTVTWGRNSTKGTAPSGAGSMVINNYTTNTTGDVDDINLPTLTLANLTSATFTFDVAHRQYSSSYADKLEVLVAAGCGATFTPVYSKSGATLATEPAAQSQYTNPTVWRNESINLTPYIGSTQVKIKIRCTSGYDNLIYLDNINITGSTGSTTPTANFTPSASSKCVGQSITFTDASTNATSWSWNFGTGATPATATGAGPHTVSYSSAGSKSVSLSVNNGAATSNQSVTINALPTVAINTLPELCTYHNPITLTQGTPAGGTYSGTGVTGSQFNPTTAGVGTKTITYSYTNAQGCSNTATAQIVVSGCLGLENEEADFISVYPNPTQGIISVRSSMQLDAIIIMDNVGRIVRVNNTIQATETTIDLDGLAAGSYHLVAKQGNSEKITKVILQ